MTLRVTHRSLFASNVNNLQRNLAKIQNTQSQLSSGKVLTKPSDDPGGTAAALRHRGEIERNNQLERNASDGLGWLQAADVALAGAGNAMGRVRELLVQANNTGSLNKTSAEAIALEIDNLRGQLLAVANTEYLGRPIFGGTTAAGQAYDDAGTFVGNTDGVDRSVRPGVTVQVNVSAETAFGAPGSDVFAFLADVSDHLRTDWSMLEADLASADTHIENTWAARSEVGAKYNQVETMRDRTETDLLMLRQQLSEIEDIDLPATIVELQLQETAYQAALSATARSVQPSLLDFLR